MRWGCGGVSEEEQKGTIRASNLHIKMLKRGKTAEFGVNYGKKLAYLTKNEYLCTQFCVPMRKGVRKYYSIKKYQKAIIQCRRKK